MGRLKDLVVDDDVVLGGDVIGNVVVDDEAHESVEEGQVDLLVHLLKSSLHHDVALTLGRVPHILQVVDACRPMKTRYRQTCIKFAKLLFEKVTDLDTTCR